MEDFEIEIDQLVPSPRVPRKNDSAVTGMTVAIKEHRIAIRTLLIAGPPSTNR